MQQEILDLIPHRPPFLFVDEILNMDETSIQVKRTVRADEPQFKGHYPHLPIMPGVLLCEATFQAAALYISNKIKKDNIDAEGQTPVVSRIKDTKFKAPVFPGDEIIIEATWVNSLSAFQFFKGSVKKNGKVCMTNEFSVALVPSEKILATTSTN